MSSGGPREADTCRDLVVPALAAAGWADGVVQQYPVKAARILTLGGVSRDQARRSGVRLA